jgi:molecular chaperone GrpE
MTRGVRPETDGSTAVELGDPSGPPDGSPGRAGDGPTVEELTDRLRRAQADVDNQRKRGIRLREEERVSERDRVIARWLPVVDNLDLAIGYADADPATLLAGVRGVRDQALAVLADLGYPRRDEVGVPFDANRHEVVAVVDDAPDAAPGTVVSMLRPGYGPVDAPLRPAAVTVTPGRG